MNGCDQDKRFKPEVSICPECGIVEESLINYILIYKNPNRLIEYVSEIEYFYEKCGTCGHQSDGSTIKKGDDK